MKKEFIKLFVTLHFVVILSVNLVFSQGSGNSLSFNGIDNYVDIGSNLVFPSSFTLMFWVKTTNDNPMTILSYGNGNSTSPHVFIGIGNNWTGSINNELITISKITNSGTSNFANTSTDRNVLFDGNWHHVAISFNGTNNFSFYIDGIFYSTQVGQFGAGYTLSGISSNYGYLGTRRYNSNFSTFFNSELDELSIWNTVLTESEIRGLMCMKVSDSHPKYANLIKYYKFDEGLGNSLTDSSQNLIHGTLVNSPVWGLSGAPIGDYSVWLSNVNISSSINLVHPNGDDLTATISSGTAELFQLYRVDQGPNNSLAPPPLTQLSQICYYGVKLIGANNAQYSVSYNYDGHPGIQNENNLGLASRVNNSQSFWSFEPNTVLNSMDNTLVLSEQTGTEFILGSYSNNTLPIEIMYFDAQPNQRIVDLTWATASELNNDYFTVEKSTDGLNWETVTVVSGQGTTSEQTNYASIDKQPYSGLSYYRLKQTDFNGEFTHSDAVSVLMNMGDAQLIHVINSLGQEVDQNTKGLVIFVFSNGETLKVINP